MGCGGGRVGIIRNNKVNILNDIKIKFLSVFKNNPFYTSSLDKLRYFQLTTNETIELDKLNLAIFKEVFTLSSSRLHLIFPKNNIVSLINLFIVLFLANPHKEEIKLEKMNLIEILINNSRTDDNTFSSGKLSYLIINLIYFICSIMIYFLFSIVILQIFEKLNKTEIEKLLVDKIKIKNISYEHLKEYFLIKFHVINPKLQSSEPILNCCLPYIFEPIKELVQMNSEEENVIITKEDIDDIKNRILFLFNPNNFLDIFLNLKIKDY